MYSFYSCVFPEREASFVLRSVGIVFQLRCNSAHRKNIRSRLIARCFGFPFHNFLTGSDSQKFRVSAEKRINTNR